MDQHNEQGDLNAKKQISMNWIDDINIHTEFGCKITYKLIKGIQRQRLSQWQMKHSLQQLFHDFPIHRIMTDNFNSNINESIIMVYFNMKKYQQECISLCKDKQVHVHKNTFALYAESLPNITINQIQWEEYFKFNHKESTFDKFPRGKRPDTVSVKGLPLKWFNIDAGNVLEYVGIYPISSSLKQAFEKFGSIRAMEASPSKVDDLLSDSSSSDINQLIQALNFDVLVQYESYEGFCNAMQNLSGSKSISFDKSSVIIPLVVDFDRSEAMTDSKIRQRRFERESKIHDRKAKLEEERRELLHQQQLYDSVKVKYEEAIKLKQLLRSRVEKELDIVNEEVDQCLNLSIDSKWIEKGNLLEFSKEMQVHEMERTVLNFHETLKKTEEKINKLIEKQELKKQKQLVQQWQKHVNEFQEDARKRMEQSRKKFEALIKDKEAEVVQHVAVIADIRSVENSMTSIESLIEKAPLIDVNTAEKILQSYANQIDEELDDLRYSMDAAEERVNLIDSYHSLKQSISSFLCTNLSEATPDNSLTSLLYDMRSQRKEKRSILNRKMEEFEGFWTQSSSFIREKKTELEIIYEEQVELERNEKILEELIEQMYDLKTNTMDDILNLKNIKERFDAITSQLQNCVYKIKNENKRKNSFLSLQEQMKETISIIQNEEKRKYRLQKQKEKEKQESRELAIEEANHKIEIGRQEERTKARKRLREWQLTMMENYNIHENSSYQPQKVQILYNRWKNEKSTCEFCIEMNAKCVQNFVSTYIPQWIAFEKPFELRLRSKIVSLDSTPVVSQSSVSKVSNTISHIQDSSKQEEEKLRALALESKARRTALTRMASLKQLQQNKKPENLKIDNVVEVSGTNMNSPLGKDQLTDEEKLRAMALSSLNSKIRNKKL